MEGVRTHGFKWQTIAHELLGRSANAVRNRYLRCVPAEESATTMAPPSSRPNKGALAPAHASSQRQQPSRQTGGAESSARVDPDLTGPGDRSLDVSLSLPTDVLGSNDPFWDSATLPSIPIEEDLFSQAFEPMGSETHHDGVG